MKKISLLLTLPVLAAMLIGCGGKKKGDSSSQTSGDTSQTSQTSSGQQSSEQQSSDQQSSISSEESFSFSSPEEEKKQTYNFYLDYSHSDEPFFTMMWWNGYPLGEMPAECRLTSADAPDEAYPVFLGWSKYSSAIDESQLWNFAKDASMNRTVSLYGIWVSE